MSFVNDAMMKVKLFWSHISLSQRVVVGSIAVALVALFFFMIIAMNQVTMVPLYTNLAAEDANRVVKSLEAQKVPFELAESGTVIMVPEDRVHQLRISIAGEGNIVGQGVGLEIFDEIKVGQTDFVQKINYQRALQGELARTISEYSSVESAKVHLVIPQRSLFIEEQKKPSAAIVIKLRDGRRLENKDVSAIVNLVTMAVEGLSKDRVSVTDSAGRTLFRPEEEGNILGLSNTQLEHRTATQHGLERKIEEMLAPVIGPGRIIAKVNVDMDFSNTKIHKELYDPDVSVMRSETSMEEQQQGRANLEAGVPDVNFRGDGLTGTVSNQSSNREQRTRNYELNKEVHDIVNQVGGVSRMTVAVLLDGTYKPNETGEMVYVPRTDEEIKNIRQLVANAVGLDLNRGDTIEVSSIPFGAPEIDAPKDFATIIADYAMRLGKPFLNALLIFLFLVIIVRPVIMALIRPKVEGEMLEELAGLPIGEERLALAEGNEEELDAMAILEKIEDIKAHALHLSEQNMDQAIGIIRSWLKPAESSKEKLPAKAA